MFKPTIKVLVIDMQPITPTIGGSRIRLWGLYHNLGLQISTTYIGSYDWPGPGFRCQRLNNNYTEVLIPLSEKHFQVDDKLKYHFAGCTIIDLTFPLLAHLSKDYINAIRSNISTYDVVIFSHPWAYSHFRENIDLDRQLLVYDSHNFEGLLRTEFHDDGDLGTEIVKEVILAEYELAHRADLVAACSEEDRNLFAQIYGIDPNKIKIISNGVFTQEIVPPTSKEKLKAKHILKIGENTALFIGSDYKPNVEAANYIYSELAPFLPEINFIFCGRVANSKGFKTNTIVSPPNCFLIGSISEEQKLQYLWAADIALNPMFTGSGTNIKMLDYLAAGLPVVSTQVGARGINKQIDNQQTMVVAKNNKMLNALRSLTNDSDRRKQLGKTGRRLVEDVFCWEKISTGFGDSLMEVFDKKKRGKLDNREKRFVGENYSTAHPLKEKAKDKIAEIYREKIAFLSILGGNNQLVEYSRNLIESLERSGIFCCRYPNDHLGLPANKLTNLFHDHTWKPSKEELDFILKDCSHRLIRKMIIQYHPESFRERILIDLAARCAEANIYLIVVLHSATNISLECLKIVSDLGAILFVLTPMEKTILKRQGINNVFHIPHAIDDISDEPIESARHKLDIEQDYVIGCYGISRTDDGLGELIESVDLLRDIHPAIKLILVNSFHTNDVTDDYSTKIATKIKKLKLSKEVQLYTCSPGSIELADCMHACDLLVLPSIIETYEEWINFNNYFAYKRPIVTHKINTYEANSAAVHAIETISPPSLSIGISTVFANPFYLRQLKECCENYLAMSDWNQVAAFYRDYLVFGN
jgi:glycosyltransferase involved in cell wall biosynthesis